MHKDIADEDLCTAIFTFDNGIIATLEAAWTINAPRKTRLSPKQNSMVRLEIIESGCYVQPGSARCGGVRRHGRLGAAFLRRIAQTLQGFRFTPTHLKLRGERQCRYSLLYLC